MFVFQPAEESRFVFMTAQATKTEVHVSYRCWPENRYTGPGTRSPQCSCPKGKAAQ